MYVSPTLLWRRTGVRRADLDEVSRVLSSQGFTSSRNDGRPKEVPAVGRGARRSGRGDGVHCRTVIGTGGGPGTSRSLVVDGVGKSWEGGGRRDGPGEVGLETGPHPRVVSRDRDKTRTLGLHPPVQEVPSVSGTSPSSTDLSPVDPRRHPLSWVGFTPGSRSSRRAHLQECRVRGPVFRVACVD